MKLESDWFLERPHAWIKRCAQVTIAYGIANFVAAFGVDVPLTSKEAPIQHILLGVVLSTTGLTAFIVARNYGQRLAREEDRRAREQVAGAIWKRAEENYFDEHQRRGA